MNLQIEADATSTADPSLHAQRREMLEKVVEAIGQLPDTERETFLLYWCAEMSYAEISAESARGTDTDLQCEADVDGARCSSDAL